MSKFEPSDYAALNLSGDNYLEWAMNTTIVLRSKGLGIFIRDEFDDYESGKFRALAIMLNHLSDELREQCSEIEDPYVLWTELKSRYAKPVWDKAMCDWNVLKFQDFESVGDYNTALMDIVFALKLYDDRVTEWALLYKTYSTFHPKDVFLLQKAKSFTTYKDLFEYLVEYEQRKQSVKDTISRYEKIKRRYIEQRDSGMVTPASNEPRENRGEPEGAIWQHIECGAGEYY